MGRKKFPAAIFCRPIRGLNLFGRPTHGYTVGYCLTPLQGFNRWLRRDPMIPSAAIASDKMSEAGFCGCWKPALLFPCPPQNQNRTRYQNEAARQQQPAVWLAISEIPALNSRVIWNFVFRQQGECGFIYRCDVSGITPVSGNGNLHFFRSVIVLNDSGPGVFVLCDDSSSFCHGNGLAVVVM